MSKLAISRTENDMSQQDRSTSSEEFWKRTVEKFNAYSPEDPSTQIESIFPKSLLRPIV